MRQFELVVPAYNEGRTLPALVQRVVEAAQQASLTAATFRLTVVDNGSSDDTARVLREIQEGPQGLWLQVVRIDVNQGYGHGVLTGLQATEADFIGWSHADMQCDPRDAFTAWSLAKDAPTPTLVKGVRHGRNWKDRAVSRTFETCARGFLGMDIAEINAQPKVFACTLLGHLKNPPKSFAFDLYVLYQAKKHGFAWLTIPVQFPPRMHGVSKWAATFVGRYKTIFGMVRYMRELQQREGRL